MAEAYDKKDAKDASDSDIICNGGYPFIDIDGVTDPQPAKCGGLTIDLINGAYAYDSPQHLLFNGKSAKTISFPEVPTFDVTQKNWHIFIYPHMVLLHSRDHGGSVEIKCPDGFQTTPAGTNARQHPNRGEIENMVLLVGNQCYFMSGCKFSIHCS